MNYQGYSINLANANQAANSKLIGVQLGRWAIARQVPVNTLAKKFKVSRATIYAWFVGKSMPRPKKAELIEKFIKEHQ